MHNLIKEADTAAKASDEKFESFSNPFSRIGKHVETLQKHQESMNSKFNSLVNILSSLSKSSNPEVATALSKVSDFEVVTPTVATIPVSPSNVQPAPHESIPTQE